MARKLWLPGAERIPGPHSAGLPMSGKPGDGHYATHHITVMPKGSYVAGKGVLVREGFEPTLLADPVLGKIGQFFPANRAGYALEHPSGTPVTNTEGAIHVQIEWCWPSMSQDITKAPHFGEVWTQIVEFCDQLGIPRKWPYGFKSTSKSLAKQQVSGHRGHVNILYNSHSDNLPAATQPAWPDAGKPLAADAQEAAALLTRRLYNRKAKLNDEARRVVIDLKAAVNEALKR